MAVVQGNIEQGVKWNPAWVERTVESYEELSRRAAAQGAEVIVFPESGGGEERLEEAWVP